MTLNSKRDMTLPLIYVLCGMAIKEMRITFRLSEDMREKCKSLSLYDKTETISLSSEHLVTKNTLPGCDRKRKRENPAKIVNKEN